MKHSLLTPPASGLPQVPFEELLEQASAAIPDTLPDRADQLMFALDIDGTLITAAGVSDRVRHAIAQAEEAGAKVVIATGRGIASTRPVVHDVGLGEGWSICSNGALTVQWGKAKDQGHDIVGRRFFDARPTAERIRAALPDVIFGIDAGGSGMRVSSPFPEGELLFQDAVVDLAELLAIPASKLVARMPGMDRDHFADLIDGLGLTGVEYAVGWTSWVDIGPEGVTKASGLQELATQLGVGSEGTIAIGDGLNDIPMLQWAGHGVAMGGAEPAVVQAANAATGPVEHDGAAAVIQAIIARY